MQILSMLMISLKLIPIIYLVIFSTPGSSRIILTKNRLGNSKIQAIPATCLNDYGLGRFNNCRPHSGKTKLSHQLLLYERQAMVVQPQLKTATWNRSTTLRTLSSSRRNRKEHKTMESESRNLDSNPHSTIIPPQEDEPNNGRSYQKARPFWFSHHRGNVSMKSKTKWVHLSPLFTGKTFPATHQIHTFQFAERLPTDAAHDVIRLVLPSTSNNILLRRQKREADLQTANNSNLLPPLTCFSQPSCYANRIITRNIFRYSCRCDDACQDFDDCCHEISFAMFDNTTIYENFRYEANDERYYECNKLPRPMTSLSVFMVTDCPDGASPLLRSRCIKDVPDDQYHYALDIPAVSIDHKHVVYLNIYCAKCHNDLKVKTLEAKLNCVGFVTDSMHYVKGELEWKKDEQNKCALTVNYDEDDLRWCPKNLIKNCSHNWQNNNTEESCFTSGTSYVKAHDNYFLNYFCALCNGKSHDQIKCPHDVQLSINASDRTTVDNVRYLRLFANNTQCYDDDVSHPLPHNCNTFDDCTLKALNISKMSPSDCKDLLLHCTYGILYPSGTIYLRKSKNTFYFGEYERISEKLLEVCSSQPSRKRWTFPMLILAKILFTISLLCLALHMLVFLLLPRQRNIPSMNLFSLTFSLFITNLIFVLFFRLPQYPLLCIVSAAVLYYFLSAAFLWMNALSVDIYRTFRSNTYKIKSNKVFIHYSIYAWIIPIFTTSVVYSVDQYASKDFIIIPDFGSVTCWFNNKWGLAAFFSLPACIIIITNMCLYGLSVCIIYKQHKIGKLASSTANQGNKMIHSKECNKHKPKMDESVDKFKSYSFKSKCESDSESIFKEKIKNKIQKRLRTNKKLCFRLALYSKLALIMGMTWIFAFLSFHTKYYILEYLFIIFNGLQGTFIFISFDCKEKVWKNLKQRLGYEATSRAMSSIINHSTTADCIPRTGNTNIRLTSYKVPNVIPTTDLQPEKKDIELSCV